VIRQQHNKFIIKENRRINLNKFIKINKVKICNNKFRYLLYEVTDYFIRCNIVSDTSEHRYIIETDIIVRAYRMS